MSGQLGLGVMISMLGGNEDTVAAVKASIGQEIVDVACKDDRLSLALANGQTLVLRDDGQSCCEHRHMTCDDDLAFAKGAVLQQLELRDGPSVERDGEPHDIQFLVVTTSKGTFTVANHNEHNGYYGGFAIVAELRS